MLIKKVPKAAGRALGAMKWRYIGEPGGGVSAFSLPKFAASFCACVVSCSSNCEWASLAAFAVWPI